jgi:hypothetical protein
LSDPKLITTNHEIDEYMSDVKNFKGVFMSDELNKIRKSKNMSFIMNYDKSHETGSHWVGIYVKNGTVYYFDSFGIPVHQSVMNYFKDTDILYNNIQHQDVEEVICGSLAISFIKLMDSGMKFNDIIKNIRIIN